jgi:hypothetical protein
MFGKKLQRIRGHPVERGMQFQEGLGISGHAPRALLAQIAFRLANGLFFAIHVNLLVLLKGSSLT